MTSQVAVFNARGVAVASDSVTTYAKGPEVQKATSGNGKVWPLGGDHLVAVLASGKVFMNQVPKRLLVAEWARTLPKPLATVGEYAKSFIEWVQNDDWLISEQSERELIEMRIRKHLRRIRNHYLTVTYSLGVPSESSTGWLDSSAGQLILELDQYPNYQSISDEHDVKTMSNLNIDVSELVIEEFLGIEIDPDFIELLVHNAPLTLARIDESHHDASLAFVGFGSIDRSATSVSVDMCGRYGGLLRCAVDESFGGDLREDGAAIKLFAQSDAINGFLAGYEPDFMDEGAAFVRRFVNDTFDTEDDTNLGALVASSLVQFMESWSNETRVQPLMRTISTLNMSGLADLAESLVGIQVTRSASSEDVSTVGGFIESLVIDRIDGVRWIQRLPS